MDWLTQSYGADEIQPQQIRSNKGMNTKTRYMFKIMEAEKAYEIYDKISNTKYFEDTD